MSSRAARLRHPFRFDSRGAEGDYFRMPEPAPESNPFSNDRLASLSRALRFFAAAFVFGLSYSNIWLAVHIPYFHQLFHDMLGNKPLPPETTFVVEHVSLFVIVSFLLPVAACVLIFFGDLVRAIYFAGVIVIAVYAQIFFQWHSLILPVETIIQNMQTSN